MAITKEVKKFLKTSDLSLRELGKKHGMSWMFIWKLGEGRVGEDNIRLVYLKKIAKMLDITLDQLCK
jgi:DNA-binding Xre family transcriptional regulator